MTTLRVPLTVPAGANCLSLDFKLSFRGIPEYVGGTVNDALVRRVWTQPTGRLIPRRPRSPRRETFAFDPSGHASSAGLQLRILSASAAQAAGTVYDGATPMLQAKTQVSAGAHILFVSIFDQGDNILDSAVGLDNLRLTTVMLTPRLIAAAAPR